ncbi:MAG TPA: DNA integrity scanning diadenylate cyclase DisA [Fervidobacterium sp.]|nr:DNA integrity scanning diadenylate cyclase DisA [Fervidobacterium sp.]HUM44403.1 DNA integrity scanning diadenylate cyclase DisA [Fervidobacterium sp.]
MAETLDTELLDKIRLVSPGTKLRKALEEIIDAELGVLIVFIDENELKANSNVFQSGFRIDCPFSPERLYELSKMDGAIVLDENVNRILAANVHLVPDQYIQTSETGTRHRTAERVAKQFEKMVIAISKRRSIVTLYYKDKKHIFEDISFVLTRVAQTINALEKFRETFDNDLELLNLREIEGNVTLDFVCEILIRGIEIRDISNSVLLNIVELGSEGRLSSLRLREVLKDLNEIMTLMILDYSKKELSEEEARTVLENMWGLEYKLTAFSKILGYDATNMHQVSETQVYPRGYRILRREIHIPMSVSQNVVKSFRTIGNLAKSDVSRLERVDGIGTKRAKAILRALKGIRKKRG